MTRLVLMNEFKDMANKFDAASKRLKLEGYEKDARECEGLRNVARESLGLLTVLDDPLFSSRKEERIKEFKEGLPNMRKLLAACEEMRT